MLTLFRFRSTPVLSQWHVKDPGHSDKCTRGMLQLNTHTPLTQRSWSGRTKPRSRHSVGTYQEMSLYATCQGTFSQSSQHTEPLWTDPGLMSGISVREIISTSKKQTQAGNEWLNLLPKLSQGRKKLPPW